ncbi:hypothetical protein BpHYR1_035127, partial [Brachionus plicatilis]
PNASLFSFGKSNNFIILVCKNQTATIARLRLALLRRSPATIFEKNIKLYYFFFTSFYEVFLFNLYLKFTIPKYSSGSNFKSSVNRTLYFKRYRCKFLSLNSKFKKEKRQFFVKFGLYFWKISHIQETIFILNN